VIIAVRSDSKSTVEQLRGLSQIRDAVMRRIFFAIANLLAKVRQTIIVFSHLKRSYNIAGLLLEQRKIYEGKWKMMGNFNTLPAVMSAMSLCLTRSRGKEIKKEEDEIMMPTKYF
jgi:hypothetical protein